MQLGIRRGLEFAACAWSLSRDLRGFFSILWAQTKNLRVHAGLGRHNPRKVYTLSTRIGPLYFRDNFGDITNLADVIWRDVYRVRGDPPVGDMLDVGANVGLAGALLGFVNPKGRLLCVEPLAACCA